MSEASASLSPSRPRCCHCGGDDRRGEGSPPLLPLPSSPPLSLIRLLGVRSALSVLEAGLSLSPPPLPAGESRKRGRRVRETAPNTSSAVKRTRLPRSSSRPSPGRSSSIGLWRRRNSSRCPSSWSGLSLLPPPLPLQNLLSQKMPTIQLWKDSMKQAEVIGGHKAWLVIDDIRQMIDVP